MKLLKLLLVVSATFVFTATNTLAAEAAGYFVNASETQHAVSALEYQSIVPTQQQSVSSESKEIWNALELISACQTAVRINLKSSHTVKFGLNAGTIKLGSLTGQSRSFGQSSNEETLILNFSLAARF